MSDDSKLIDFSGFDLSKVQLKPKGSKNFNKKLSILDNSGEITSKHIIQSLYLRFHNHRYMINNAYIFDWESDFFTVTESDYLYEIEIKVSRSDFKDDFNKKDKHILLEGNDAKKYDLKPNKFFYAAPKGLLSTYEIPEYAGLIEVNSATDPAIIIKEAPFLHKNKILERYKDTLLDKFAWRYREELLKKYENELNNFDIVEEIP